MDRAYSTGQSPTILCLEDIRGKWCRDLVSYLKYHADEIESLLLAVNNVRYGEAVMCFLLRELPKSYQRLSRPSANNVKETRLGFSSLDSPHD